MLFSNLCILYNEGENSASSYYRKEVFLVSMQKAIYQRQAVRDFATRKVASSDLDEILDAGQAAPVGMGEYEKFHLTLCTDTNVISRIESDSVSTPYYGAPAVILVSAQKQGASVGAMEYVSAGTIVENMALTATARGLASCVIMGALGPLSKDTQLLADMKIPQNFVPVISLAVGYPNKPQVTPEKSRHEIETDKI